MQKAKITVSGVSRNSDGVSRLETVNTGTFTEKNGYCYARYEETEASGMSGTTTTVKWNSMRCSRSLRKAARMPAITGRLT